ncbi:hypothetical protein SK128_012391, partial [Halocaridina rubra]
MNWKFTEGSLQFSGACRSTTSSLRSGNHSWTLGAVGTFDVLIFGSKNTERSKKDTVLCIGSCHEK